MRADVGTVVIGGGLVGLATARAILSRHPDDPVVVVDKESSPGTHQSGRNSGVIHSGLYYRPDSRKAALVRSGRPLLERLADDHGLDQRRCGKLVVATEAGQIPALLELRRRGRLQDLDVRLVDRRGIHRREPHVEGMTGLVVPETGVIDFAGVARALAAEITAHPGGTVLTDWMVARIETDAAGATVTSADGSALRTETVVNCAGLHSDTVSTMAGQDPPVSILPFRGEYVDLVPEARHLIRHLVYPVPDPRFPFLGVHFTRSVDGSVHAGPNAVVALAREGYDWTTVDPAHVRSLLTRPDARRLARRYWREGSREVLRSLSLRRLVVDMSRLVPDIERRHLRRAGSGVRAQAVRPDGTLEDDFVFCRTERVLSVLNAPSPAATASLAIGAHIADVLRVP